MGSILRTKHVPGLRIAISNLKSSYNYNTSIDQATQESRPILEVKVNCMKDRKVLVDKISFDLHRKEWTS